MADIAEGHARNAIVLLEKVLVTAPEKRAEVIKEVRAPVVMAHNLGQLLIEGKGWNEIAQALIGIPDGDVDAVRDNVIRFSARFLRDKGREIAGEVLLAFLDPAHHRHGKAGLTAACWVVVKGYSTSQPK